MCKFFEFRNLGLVALALLLPACLPYVETPPALPATETEIPITSTATKPVATRVSRPTPAPSIGFPVWANDPGLSILLTPLVDADYEYLGMGLVNAETGDIFQIPVEDIGGYFWTPDGKSIGLLTYPRGSMQIANLQDGSVKAYRFADDRVEFMALGGPSPNYATSNDPESEGFRLLSSSMSLSPNGRYLLDPQGNTLTHTELIELNTGAIRSLGDPLDGFFALDRQWAPSKEESLLAITSADQEPGNGGGFRGIPQFLLSIYDADTTELIAEIDNVTAPMWSPDASQFLYSQFYEYSEGYFGLTAAPCVYDIPSGGKRCYNNLLPLHSLSGYSGPGIYAVSWSPTGDFIGYIYFQTNSSLWPNNQDGGLCLVETSTAAVRCHVKTVATDESLGNLVPASYTWSPAGDFMAVGLDYGGPHSEVISGEGLGILNIETGEFVMASAGIRYTEQDLGLWRPLLEQ